jgi:hypothetical protein
MRQPEIIKYKGKEVLYLNFTNLRKNNHIKSLESLGGEYIRQQELNSVLVLTNMENMYFDLDIRKHFIKVVKENEPYVRASAVIGLYGLISFMYDGFIKLSGRNIKQFKTRKEAMEYLISFA